MLAFDHIVIAAETLEAGISHVKDRLGVDIPYGGKHPLMGTHNHVMQLGSEAFLEVIAIDPEASRSRDRWFWLDHFKDPPRIWHWVARVQTIADAAGLSADTGPAIDLTRGDLHWQLTVREDGTMPFDGAHPSIICWPEGVFPVPNMADLGCRLKHLSIFHPERDALKAALDPHLEDERIEIRRADKVAFSAQIMTPLGLRTL